MTHEAQVVLYIVLFLGWISLTVLLETGIKRDNFHVPVYSAIAIWFLATMAVGTRLWFLKCPHCGGRFHVKRWSQNLFSFKCVHCGNSWPGKSTGEAKFD
jgi:hypothetical protein